MEVNLNGAQIHYERAGAGFPVIFLHAGIADSRMWEPQISAFAKHFDVVRPDKRGFGSSELPPMSWSPVEDLLALINGLGLKPAHLVGCSMGGAVAIDFALDHPDRISKLVLVGSAIGGFTFRPEHAQVFALDMNGIAVRADQASAPTKNLDPPAIGRLHEITAPTLVVVGDKDVLATLEAADLLTDSIPNARKAVIHDAAHLPNLEHPEEFNRLVLDFLLAD